MKFGERLRNLRKEVGLSQRELADRVGIDFTYLSKVETGRMPPPAEETIEKIAKELRADADELMILAEKIPSDFKNVIIATRRLPEMLRVMKGKSYTREEWAKMMEIASKSKSRRVKSGKK